MAFTAETDAKIALVDLEHPERELVEKKSLQRKEKNICIISLHFETVSNVPYELGFFLNCNTLRMLTGF